MSGFTNIRAALIQAYETGAFGLATAYENKPFTPTSGTPWAALYILPAQPSVSTLGSTGADLHTGVMQIDLYYPLDSGDLAAVEMADTIAATFVPGTYFTKNGQPVMIVQTGRSQGAVEDNGWYRIMVNIQYRARVYR